MFQRNNFTRFIRPVSSIRAVAMAIVVMTATSACSKPPEPTQPAVQSMTSEPMDHSKMDGMKHMDGMSMTGDVDYDFAANMRMHHQMAVDMSEAELKNGKDPQMLQMAKDIIAAQKKEITVLGEWLNANKKP